MIIATVNFTAGGKTYDYLVRADHKVDKRLPVRLVRGITLFGEDTQTINVIAQRRVSSIPTWVTKVLVIDAGNKVHVEPIKEQDLQRAGPKPAVNNSPPLSPPPKANKQVKRTPVKVVTFNPRKKRGKITVEEFDAETEYVLSHTKFYSTIAEDSYYFERKRKRKQLFGF